jgi:uncharacterized protein YndB with AHSA1/START domain
MQYTTTINAPREKVWQVLWNDDTYPEWTSAFAEGSRAETDWKKGSKVLFTDGKGSGMVSRIDENVPNQFMGITHMGILKDGVEDLGSDEAKNWAGSYENYTLTDSNGGTHLRVDMGGAEMPKEFQDYFEQAWPKALARLKAIAEG